MGQSDVDSTAQSFGAKQVYGMSWNKYVVSENGTQTEATSITTTLNPEEKQVVGAQVNSESVVCRGYEAVTVCVPAEMPPDVPVTGESFCQCPAQTELNSDVQINANTLSCTCGEEEEGCDWVWDTDSKSSGVSLSCSNRTVSFHSEYSCGTAAVRGSRALSDGQHFWEIKMTSPVYGTDMMVGIGTSEVNLDQFRHSFCSMLGTDEDSWGLSYTGHLHHEGSKVNFSSRFGQGSIIGVHLDTWHGTLSFYKNRRRIGVADTNLQNKHLYPMVCSTAAKSSMKLIRSHSVPTTLQYLCCTQLRNILPDCADALHVLSLPPGLLLSNQLGWVLNLGCADRKDKAMQTEDQYISPKQSRTLSNSERDFIFHSTDELHCDSPFGVEASVYPDESYQDSVSVMDVACYLNPSSSSDHALYCGSTFLSDHTSPSDPTYHHTLAVCPSCDSSLPIVSVNDPKSCNLCPASSLPGHTSFVPDSTSDSDSDEFFSDLETCQRKRCRWT
nr:SPRY domain-containing SOCS box protein 3 isoform X1 [Misgurnus anguillicaudatus]